MRKIKNKTIMMVVEDGFVARSFLRSDLLSLLKDNFGKVVVLAPEKKIHYYSLLYGDKNVVFDKIRENTNGMFQKALFKVMKFSIPTRINRVKLMRTIYNPEGGIKRSVWLVYFPLLYISWFLGGCGLWRGFLRKIYSFFPEDACSAEIINKHKPDIIFANYSDIGVNNFNLKILRAAKNAGVFSVGNIFSWDNLFSKVFIPFHTHCLAVPNRMVKKEAERPGDFGRDKIFVTGSPHFDFYQKKEEKKTREDFFRSIGADPDKKLILFALGNKLEEINLKKFFLFFRDFLHTRAPFAQLYVRPYPKRPPRRDVIKDFEKDFIFPSLRKIEDVNNFEFEENDNNLLFNLLEHSSLIISFYSTMPIDASFAGKPVIIVNYSNRETPRNYFYSVEVHKDFEHIRHLLNYEAARAVNNNEQLAEQIKAYLENPRRDAPSRNRLMQDQRDFPQKNSALAIMDLLRRVGENNL